MKSVDLLIPAIVALFGWLTARTAITQRRTDAATSMGEKSFDAIMKRLEIAETELSILKNLQHEYDVLNEKYNDLIDENKSLKARIKQLEDGAKT